MNDEFEFEKSFGNAVAYLRRASRIMTRAKILGSVIGAALVGSSPWLGEQSWENAANWSSLALWVGLILTLSSAILLIFLDETTPSILADNLGLARDNEVLSERFSYVDGYIDHLLTRISLSSYVREAVEAALIEGCSTVDDLGKYSNGILGLLAERRSSLFGINDEYWNFSVYRFDPEKNALRCIACKREKVEDETGPHRDWAAGEGHVGLAFSRAKEIIFSDATKPEMAPILNASGANQRDYDSERYVSLASMPISTDGKLPLGILVATSDKKGRFSNDSERGDKDWEREDALREVAAYLAILFQLIQTAKK